jgi:tRNA A37 threonylcarbamoyladenosine dehydratase
MAADAPEGPMRRFDGIGRLYGAEALGRLQRAHVCVVGLGGVGAWAAEALARSGIGAMTLVDGDDVCVSNVNRQLHALDGAIGRPKAEVMAERIRAIHPGCRVRPVCEFFRRSMAESLFSGSFDAVVDAIDALTPKAELIVACRRRSVPVVCCGGSGGKKDPGLIRVADLSATAGDRLLFAVRKKLRSRHGFPPRGKPFGIPCVYSEEPPAAPAGGADPGEAFVLDGPRRINCEHGLGSAAFVTGSFGFRAAAVVVAMFAGPGPGAESRPTPPSSHAQERAE